MRNISSLFSSLFFIHCFQIDFARVRKVYEINEDVESPTRCPVKLYEFYLSKWWVKIMISFLDIHFYLLNFWNDSNFQPTLIFHFICSNSPESVRTRNDLFYLLPERNCVPDSSIWYSTKAMEKNALLKMFNRLQMVKEINIALLANWTDKHTKTEDNQF